PARLGALALRGLTFVHPSLDTIWVVEVGTNGDVLAFPFLPGSDDVAHLAWVLGVVERTSGQRVVTDHVDGNNCLVGRLSQIVLTNIVCLLITGLSLAT